MATVTPADLLRRMKADLATWATANKAEVSVAEDALSALEILADSPGRCRVVLNWAGERNLSNVPDLFMFEQTVEVSLAAAKDMAVAPGGSVHTAPAFKGSLLALLQSLKAYVLGQTWDAGTTGQNWQYRETRIAGLPGGMPLRAYTMTFAIETAPAAVTDHAVSA